MTDATDAVDTSYDFSSFVPSLPLLWIGTGQKAEVSPPNSLYSLCGGSKTTGKRKKIKEKAFIIKSWVSPGLKIPVHT